jgi:hypothetical protein
MPYDLKFTGGFFEIADFLESLDRMVMSHGGRVAVDGRLLTVNGFSLAPSTETTATRNGTPTLTASLSVTTFLTPADQGITAGATPAGPLPVTATPASATTSTDSIPDSAPATP